MLYYHRLESRQPNTPDLIITFVDITHVYYIYVCQQNYLKTPSIFSNFNVQKNLFFFFPTVVSGIVVAGVSIAHNPSRVPTFQILQFSANL